MAKTNAKNTNAKKPPTRKAAAHAGGALVTTLEGEKVPAAELEHIAPHLRPFAVRVDSLTRDPRNARRHSDRDLPSTERSLRRWGQQELLQFEPETRVIKVGNGRHECAERLGWAWVAAVPSSLTGPELKAFALAHNRTGEKAEWDLDELDRQVKELAAEVEAFDAADLGFDEDEYKALLEEDWESAHAFGSRGNTADKPAEKQDDKPAGEDPGEKPPGNNNNGNGGGLSDQYKLILTCRDEMHQTDLLDALDNNAGTPEASARLAELLKGVECRVLVG